MAWGVVFPSNFAGLRDRWRDRNGGDMAVAKQNIELGHRFRPLPPANEPPEANECASYHCDECGEPDWADVHAGGEIRKFYADDERGDRICERCAMARGCLETATTMNEKYFKKRSYQSSRKYNRSNCIWTSCLFIRKKGGKTIAG